MLTLKGRLINKFVTPKSERDGKEIGGQDKVQILGEVSLPNGEVRMDMFTLTTHNASDFNEMDNSEIRVPIGLFAAGSKITYYIPKGSVPEIC